MSRARNAVATATGVALVVAVVAALRASAPGNRGPFERPVTSPAPPSVSVVGGVRRVVTTNPPMELIPDSVPPTRAAQLLWLGGRVAESTRDGSVVLDAAGGVVEFDRHLRPRPVPIESEGREWLSVAPGRSGTYWLTDATGALLLADAAGHVSQVAATGFQFPTVATDVATGLPVVARSSKRFAYVLDTADDSPLVVVRDADGTPLKSLGRAGKPDHILLRDLANAGQVAADTTAVYFAPFIRDELIAFSRSGDTLWIASRGLPHGTADPKFEVRAGKVTIDYSPVNLGLTIGPDGNLYLLSTPERTTSTSRLDVFDRTTGALLRSVTLPTALPSLAADADGRVYALDEVQLLAGVPARSRPAATAFDLQALDSGRVQLSDYRGRVVLVNLWASWCAPCREEMPALDSLARTFDDPAFAFVALSDDVAPSEARAFLRARHFTFRVGLGRGSLRDQFHAPGLPVTVLIDRDGREIHRWIGYAGPTQTASISALVRAELDRGAPPMDMGHGAHHHTM